MTTTAELVRALDPITSRVRTDVTAVKSHGKQAWTTDALTDETLAAHVSGRSARGVCPIKAGESTTRLALLDLDSHKGEVSWADMAAVAERLTGAMHAAGLHTIPFRSSGGNGLHLLTLWDDPQDAHSVREQLRSIIASEGFTDGSGGIAHHQIEVFPRQSEVGPDGYGNQFILPLAGQSVPLEPLLGFEPLPREHITKMAWPVSQPVPVVEKPQRQQPTSDLAQVVELHDLREALRHIPNEDGSDLSYENWRSIIFGIWDATQGSDEGLQLAHEVSSRSSKYDAEFLESRVWAYVTPREGGQKITAATIYAMANAHGYVDTSSLPDYSADAPTPEKRKRFQSRQAALFASGKPADYIVKGVIPHAELVVVYGASTAGKSFWVLDLCMAISRGVPWRDRKVHQGSVVYVAAEGAGGFRNRLHAHAIHSGIDLSAIPLHVISDAPNLMLSPDIVDIVAEMNSIGQDIKLVVVDTFSQCIPGASENAGDAVGKALANCKAIHRHVRGNPTTLLVHHSGKDEAKGARGWSGLRAAADAEIEIARCEDDRVATITKQKDGMEGSEFGFKLLDVQIGKDDDNEDVVSAVVEHCAASSKSGVSGKDKLTPEEKLAWRAANDAISLGGEGITSVELRRCVASVLPVTGEVDRRLGRADKLLTSLAAKKWLRYTDGAVEVLS